MNEFYCYGPYDFLYLWYVVILLYLVNSNWYNFKSVCVKHAKIKCFKVTQDFSWALEQVVDPTSKAELIKEIAQWQESVYFSTKFFDLIQIYKYVLSS